MGIRSAGASAHVTLAGTTVLHAFTHIFGTMLVPLYLLLQKDLGLTVKEVGLIVTVYGVAYWFTSFQSGALADRYNRKTLLGIGLLGNSLCVIAMGLSHRYDAILALAAVAGLFGSLFHPTANALVPALYPKAPAMAIGLLGIGSGIGFYVGPRYAGWSAANSHWGTVAAWQRPLIELGIGGIVVAIAYLLFAREAGEHKPAVKPQLPPRLRGRTLAHAVLIALREFSTVGTMSLSALFLLKVLHYDTAKTGAYVGMSMLVAAVVNPLTIYLTPGKRRLPAHVAVLILAGLAIGTLPHWSEAMVLPVLVVGQTFALVSSAVTDAGLAERIRPEFRGRVNGMFLTIVGGAGALSPFAVGAAVDWIGVEAASTRAGFYGPFAVLGLLMLAATASAWTLVRLEMKDVKAEEAGTPGVAAVASSAC